MQKNLQRRKLSRGNQAETPTNKALGPIDKTAETLGGDADSTKHTVQYLGWFGLSRTLDSDFEPYGKRSRHDGNPKDCSCGCRYFVALAPSSLALDWGCCLNKKSPRAGLLTFEHQGCREFAYGPAVA